MSLSPCPKSRRFTQFSLRAVLLIVTFSCVLFANEARRGKERRQAFASLAKLCQEIESEPTALAAVLSFGRPPGPDQSEIVGVSLSCDNVREALPILATIPSLRMIEVYGFQWDLVDQQAVSIQAAMPGVSIKKDYYWGCQF